MIEIIGRTELHPTEDAEKVRSAIRKIFPGSTIEERESEILFKTDDVDEFLKIISDQRIRDTAVMVFERSLCEDKTFFHLHKQAASVGVVNLSDGASTLGDLEVKVIEGAQDLIRRTAPRAMVDNSVQHHLNTDQDNS
jgi:predicted RNA binding protein with dsRBD fold (UPF0201 family)